MAQQKPTGEHKAKGAVSYIDTYSLTTSSESLERVMLSAWVLWLTAQRNSRGDYLYST